MQLKNLSLFSYKSNAGHPGFHRLRALGLILSNFDQIEYFSFSLIDPDAPQLQAPLPVFVQQAAAAKMIGCGKSFIVVV